MSKTAGVFKFDYVELKDKKEISSSLVIETKDVVRSIGKFGESRKLVKLYVKELNSKL